MLAVLIDRPADRESPVLVKARLMRLSRKPSARERVFIKFSGKDCGLATREKKLCDARERVIDQSSSIVPSCEELYAKVIQMLSATLIFA